MYFDLVPDADPNEVPAAPAADVDDADNECLAGICGPSGASSSASRPSDVAGAHLREFLLTYDGIDEGLLSALDEALRPYHGDDADLFCRPEDLVGGVNADAEDIFGEFGSIGEDVRADASGGAEAAGGVGDGAAVLGGDATHPVFLSPAPQTTRFGKLAGTRRCSISAPQGTSGSRPTSRWSAPCIRRAPRALTTTRTRASYAPSL